MQSDFERLDVFQVALSVARWLPGQSFPRGMSDLKSQAVRAAQSAVLNIAEGVGRRGDARRNHYAIARGSANEALAALLMVDLPGGDDMAERLRRVDRMLQVLGA